VWDELGRRAAFMLKWGVLAFACPAWLVQFGLESYLEGAWISSERFLVGFISWAFAGILMGWIESLAPVRREAELALPPRCHDCGEHVPLHTAWCPTHRGLPLRLSRS
jgi:hypothetical protein